MKTFLTFISWLGMTLLSAALALTPTKTAVAQSWSGIIDPSRAIDWSNAGAHPNLAANRVAVCQTINPYSGTAAIINTAILNCANAHTADAGGIVQLAAGTFTLSTTIDFQSKNNVTLRGAGANSTFVVFNISNNNSCAGFGGANICLQSANNGDGGDQTYDNLGSWTGGYSRGSTSITVNGFTKGGISGLQIGSLIFLDQLDDSSIPTGGVFVCQNATCSSGGSGNGRNWRPSTQEEPQIITSISGSGPWTVGISPGIRMPNISGTRAPQLWSNSGLPIQNNGIENMSLDTRNSQNFSNIFCLDCYNVWAKNLRLIGQGLNGSGTYQFWAYQSKNITLRDSYGFGSASSSNNYMFSCWGGADVLYENNITQHMAFSYMNEGCIGGVQSYSYSIDDYYTGTPAGSAPDWQQASSYHHGSGDAYLLWEGNEGFGATGDDVHGTSNLATVFRNYYNGRDPNGGSNGGKTSQTNPIILYTYNRLWNVVGNVLGTIGYHNTYQCAYPSPSSCSNTTQIYSLGYKGDARASDAYTATSLMRWGNYDVVNNAVRFVNSEVPSGLTDGFANSVPASQSLPTSFFKNAQPNWWGVVGQPAIPWPAIGPDVTGGNIANVGAHANHIPAADCYLNVMKGPTNGSATLMSFDAAACYGAGSPPPPSSPVITSALTASGTTGFAFSYQITATNSPTSFNAVGLPAGLTVNTATGLISGTPTTGGTSSVTLSATNASGTGLATLSLTVYLTSDLNSYKCRRGTQPTPRFSPRDVPLADQFETQTASVRRLDTTCNPANVNGEGVVADPSAHLACYRIQEPGGFTPRGLLVRNRFGDETLTLVRARQLCVPSEQNQVPSALNIDHYKCYEASRPAPPFAHQTVDLVDDFGQETAVVLKPDTFCNAVDKNGEGVKDQSAHLACYRIKDRGGRPAPASVTIHNQFGDETLTLVAARSLCVPSTLP